MTEQSIKLLKQLRTFHNGTYAKAIDEAIASAEPKKGEWVDFSMSIKGVPTEACGECGEWSLGMGKNYCPNCGADMRGEEDDS